MCHPSYTDRILLRPLLMVCFAKIYGRKSVTISLQASLTFSMATSKQPLYKTSTLTPFVKPRQVLSYLDVAIAKKLRNSHKIACEFCNFLSVKLARIFGQWKQGCTLYLNTYLEEIVEQMNISPINSIEKYLVKYSVDSQYIKRR